MLLLEHDLQLGRIFVADGQPEGAVGLEHADHFGGPLAAPVQVVIAFELVVVDVVVVADVEGRIGKGQIDHAVAELPQALQAILIVDRVQTKCQGSVSSGG